MKEFKKYIIYLIPIVSLIFTLIFMNYISFEFTDVFVKNHENKHLGINFPFLVSVKTKNKTYSFSGNIYSKEFCRFLNIRFVGQLVSFSINEKPVSLDNIKGNMDYREGVHIDISSYLKPGKNTFEILMTDKYGKIGLDLSTSSKNKSYYVVKFLFLIQILILFYLYLYLFLSYLKFDKPVIVIFFISLFTMLIYLNGTEYNERTHDYMGHIEYIIYILKNFKLPSLSETFQSYQPPLYYLIGAFIYAFADTLGIGGLRGLQIFSVFCYMVFLVFGILILQRAFNINVLEEVSKDDRKKNLFLEDFRRKHLFYFAVSLFTLWPSGIIHSARIGNEVMLYMLYGAGLYFTIRWFEESKIRDLYIASVFVSLSIMTKFTGVIIGVILGTLLIYNLYEKKAKINCLKKFLLPIIILLLGFTPYMVRSYSVQDEAREAFVLKAGNQLGQTLIVDNYLHNYIYFDVKAFLEEPFLRIGKPMPNNNYFWNYLLKSSLFGEFRYNYNFGFFYMIGRGINFLFLIILSFFLIRLFTLKKEDVKAFIVLLLNMFFLLAAIFVYRYKIPYSCCNDFRLIYPIIISFIPIFILSIKNIKEKGYILPAFIFYFSMSLFIILSFLFCFLVGSEVLVY